MTQVYSFVDENGVTRLFAEIIPDPAGTPFNGGTITAPLVIDDATASSIALRVQSANPSGDGQLTFQVEDSTGAPVFTVDSDGQTRVETQDAFGDFRVRIANQERFRATSSQAEMAFGAQIVSLNVDGLIQSGINAAPDSLDLSPGDFGIWLDKTNGASKLMVKAASADGTVVAPGLTGRDLATAPAVSAASTLALGTAYQNTLGYDVLLCVYLSVTVNTSGVLKLGVGPTTTPTQQTLVTGITSTGLWPVPIYLPNTYYALLSVTGTITVAVDGQIAMPV